MGDEVGDSGKLRDWWMLLMETNCSGGKMWFWWIKEFSLWASTCS